MSIAVREIFGFLRPGAQRVGPIGLQFSDERINLVQLDRDGRGQLNLKASASIPYETTRDALLSDAQKVRTLLRSALGKGFRGRTVISAMPPEHVRMLSVTYRPEADREDADLILEQITERLDSEISDYVVDYLPVRTAGDERRALVAVTPAAEVITFLETLRKAGLTVDALEIGPVAVKRLVSAMTMQNQPNNVLVINFGRDVAYMTMISERRLLFDHEIGFGEQRIVKRVADSLRMSEELARGMVLRIGLDPKRKTDSSAFGETGEFDALLEIVRPEFKRLVDEVRRVLLYAASETRGGTVDRIYVLGSIARWPGAAGLLDSMSDVTVSTVPDPLSLFGTHESGPAADTPPDTELAIATGLALRGLTDDE